MMSDKSQKNTSKHSSIGSSERSSIGPELKDRCNGRPLITFCFNTEGDIWEQDMWNNQLFNRVHDVLSQRTNQIQPRPRPTIEEACFCCIQTAQDELDKNTCTDTDTDFKMNKPIRPDDNFNIKSVYNNHYRMGVPKHQMTNIRQIQTESDLYTLGVPWTNDCMSLTEAQKFEEHRKPSGKHLYRTYHNHEVNSPCYPNLDRSIFHNTTKEIDNTVDNRNQYILWIEPR